MKFPIFNKKVSLIGEARQVTLEGTSLNKVLNDIKEDINRVSNKTDTMFIGIPSIVKEDTQALFSEEENDYLAALFSKSPEEVILTLNKNVLFYTNDGGTKECASKPIFVYANKLPSSVINYIVFAIPVTDGESIAIHSFVLTKNKNAVTLSDISASSFFVYSDGLPLFQET